MDKRDTESKSSWLPWASIYKLKRGQDHAGVKKQAIPNHLPHSQLSIPPATPGTTQEALFTWLFPSNQDISSTTVKPYVLSPSLE